MGTESLLRRETGRGVCRLSKASQAEASAQDGGGGRACSQHMGKWPEGEDAFPPARSLETGGERRTSKLVASRETGIRSSQAGLLTVTALLSQRAEENHGGRAAQPKTGRFAS